MLSGRARRRSVRSRIALAAAASSAKAACSTRARRRASRLCYNFCWRIKSSKKAGRPINHLQLPKRIIVALIAVLQFALASGIGAAEVKLPPIKIESLTLPNGLRALFVERHEVPVASVEVWYHVGSKNEQPGRTGFAHLFEHLMFDGTRNVGPEQFSSTIVRTGGEDNAFTTEDTTVFWETVPSSNLSTVVWLEADRMRNLTISAQTLQNEIQVVKEERRLRFDNQPYGSVVETLYAHAFTVHPYHHTAIGSMEDLDHATVEAVREFYDTYYVPNNATVVVTGDFDTPQAEGWVRRYFGPLARGARPIERQIPAEPPQTAERVVQLRLDVALPACVEGFHMPADGTPDAYPLRLATKILSDGESSLIYRRLVYEKQIATDAECTGNFTEDPNLFFVFAVMNPGHSPAEGEQEVGSILAELRNKPVSADEIDKAKNQILRDFILGRETDRRRAEELGYDAVVLNDPELVNNELARFLAVTPEDIQRAARKYLVPENKTLVEVQPKEENPEARNQKSEASRQKSEE